MSYMDMKELDKLVKNVEKYLKGLELNPYEQHVLLTLIRERFDDRLRDVKMKDSISNMPLGGLMNRIMKGNLE